jgi:Chromo (CHRromatin Organisation MOdifier) domain
VYRCSKDYNEKQFGFAEFCFRCSRWITSGIDWEAHCQDHIKNLDLPFRCDPVNFRHATACAGYCSACLGKEWLPAAVRMQQFQDRPSWHKHISECIPAYVANLDNKDSIPCPHLLCSMVLYSESDLWNHLGDNHSTHKPDAGRKRQRQREGDEPAETPRVAKRKQLRPQGKLEDGDSNTPAGRKSVPKGRSKDPLKFVNMSTMDFNPSSADVIEMTRAASGSSLCSTSDDSIWDKHDNRHSTNTSLSCLSDDILEAFTQTGEGCHSPRTNPSEVTDDLFGDAKSWNFDANADTISSPIEPFQEDWILCGSGTTPLSYLSSVPMELVDPQLQDALPSSTPGLPATTDSVEDAHRSIPTAGLGHIENSATQPLCGSQEVEGQPVAIDAKRGIWEAEALLAKWKQGKTTWYLVKWKGFPHEDNTWQKPKDIGQKLVKDFEAIYQGNRLGVRLLKKRERNGRVEYLIKWKGRPESENSWEKEATISRERIIEFEAS